MPEIHRILCPVDFSEASTHAIAHAVVLARWYHAKIIGLHVQNPIVYPVPGLSLAGYPAGSAGEEIALAQLEEDLAAELRDARAAGVDTDVVTDSGSPVIQILDRARSLAADLIVMGTHGAGGFEHLVLGSVTEKVLRKAVCPVLVVPPRAHATSRLPFERILCPVDLSPSSAAALQFACSLAQAGSAELTILHVLEWPSDEEPRPNRAFNVPEYRIYRETDAAAALEQLVTSSVREKCKPVTRLAHGKSYREILGVATEGSADLIVMGVQGRNALDVMLFGSTVNQVVRRATCPVLTLRP